MRLILSLCLFWIASVALAEAPVPLVSPKALPVKEKPDEASRTLFYAQRGEKVWQFSVEQTYTRVKIKHKNQWVVGYILTEDLNAPMEPEPEVDEAPQPSRLGLGLGGVYSSLSQKGKQVQDSDQVNYTLSDYTSQSFWPYVVAQWERENFWQLRIGYRSLKFSGTAKADVAPIPPQPATVDSQMIMGALARVWSFGPVFVGPTVEVDHGLSLAVKINGITLPTTSADYPNYIGVGAIAGAQTFINEHFSLFGELRYLDFVNLQQVTGIEGDAAAVYWF